VGRPHAVRRLLVGSFGRMAATVVILMLAAAACEVRGASPSIAPYGEKVHFRQGVALHFRDFDLIFLGARHQPSPQFPPGFMLDEFRVTRGKESQVVIWSSGTGDIGPVRFKVSGREFALELQISEARGMLKTDEVVVTPVKGTA